jgi:hypothetical protein
LVKAQEGRRHQNKGRTDQPGRRYQQRAPTGDEAIREAEIRGALAGAVEDQELMLLRRDSATTERTPPGLGSRTTVVRR